MVQTTAFNAHELRRTMKLWIGSSGGCPAGLPGHVFGAGTGQPNWGCASSAVSVHPSLGSLHPFCRHEHPHILEHERSFCVHVTAQWTLSPLGNGPESGPGAGPGHLPGPGP